MIVSVRAVLDTNIFVSALQFGGVPRLILDAVIAQGFRVLASLENRSEVDGVLRAKFLWTQADLDDLGRTFWSLAEIVAVRRRVNICRDPKDNHLLETCVAAGARFPVMGDNDLLVLSAFESCAIVTPRQFLDRLSVDFEPEE